MDFYDEIYFSLVGQMTPDAALPWVTDAFAPGSPCEQAYARLLEARERIQRRLGGEDDRDLCQMLSEMETIQRQLCRCVMMLRRM